MTGDQDLVGAEMTNIYQNSPQYDFIGSFGFATCAGNDHGAVASDRSRSMSLPVMTSQPAVVTVFDPFMSPHSCRFARNHSSRSQHKVSSYVCFQGAFPDFALTEDVNL